MFLPHFAHLSFATLEKKRLCTWNILEIFFSSPVSLQTAEIATLQRLGKVQPGPTPRPRPIKVELKYANERQNILRDTNKLKLAGEMMKKMYVKRDTHPGITRELKRLKDVEKREKEKPENQGKTVQYDWKQRCVMVDNVIVDKYQPTFF